MINVKNIIYMFGGNGPCYEAEKLDLRQWNKPNQGNFQWERIANMKQPLSWLGTAEHKGWIYMQGYGSQFLQRYSIENDNYEVLVDTELASKNNWETDYAILCSTQDLIYIFKGPEFYSYNPKTGEQKKAATKQGSCYSSGPVLVYKNTCYFYPQGKDVLVLTDLETLGSCMDYSPPNN